MSGCRNDRELEQFLRGEGPPDVAEHLAACARCRQALLEIAMQRKAVNSLLLTLARERDCLEYEEISACLESSPTPKDSLIAWLHLTGCPYCQEELTALQAGRMASRNLPYVVLRPAVPTPWPKRLAAWKEILRPHPMRWATAGALLVMLAFGFHRLSLKPESSSERMAYNPPPPSQMTPAKPSPVRLPGVRKPARTHSRPGRPVRIALLKDGKGTVALRQGGKLEWPARMPPLPPSLIRLVARKMRHGSVQTDRPIQVALGTSLQDTVRGPEATLKLREPVKTAVLSPRPRLEWDPLKQGGIYQVKVSNQQGKIIWTGTTSRNAIHVDTRLAGGGLYVWEVAADDGERIYLSRPAPFWVVAESKRRRLQGLSKRFKGWHLVLGTLYESEGLYREAQREFQALKRLNPRSSLADRVLRGIEKKYQGTEG